MGAQAHHRITIDVDGGSTISIPSHYCSADQSCSGSVRKRVKEELESRAMWLRKIDYAKYVDGIGWEVRVFVDTDIKVGP